MKFRTTACRGASWRFECRSLFSLTHIRKLGLQASKRPHHYHRAKKRNRRKNQHCRRGRPPSSPTRCHRGCYWIKSWVCRRPRVSSIRLLPRRRGKTTAFVAGQKLTRRRPVLLSAPGPPDDCCFHYFYSTAGSHHDPLGICFRNATEQQHEQEAPLGRRTMPTRKRPSCCISCDGWPIRFAWYDRTTERKMCGKKRYAENEIGPDPRPGPGQTSNAIVGKNELQ